MCHYERFQWCFISPMEVVYGKITIHYGLYYKFHYLFKPQVSLKRFDHDNDDTVNYRSLVEGIDTFHYRTSACDSGRKATLVIGWVTKILLYWAPPCFGRHVKPLVPAVFAVVSTHQLARTGPAWWVKALSYLLSIRKACAPAVGKLISWWWCTYIFLWDVSATPSC
jgi:hypothetical protein